MVTPKNLEFHPIANLFPLIEGADFADLVADIDRNGVLEAIEIYDNKILDGRNRYRAWQACGSDPEKIRIHFYTGSDPLGYVISKNLRRRHLTDGQRAMIAAELPKVQLGNRLAAPKEALTREERAELLNVTKRSVDRASDVLEEGAPELVQAVKDGDVAVSAAAQITALPKEQQVAIMKQLARDEGGHLTPEARAHIKSLSKEIRADEQKKKLERRVQREAELGAKQKALPEAKFGVILADPEWSFEPYSEATGMDRAADNHYPTSATEIIAARPVADIAADDCVLFLWATVPMIKDALRVMEAWGFEYKSLAVWGKDRVGTGYWFRNKCELLLVGTRGNIPAPAMGTQWESLIMAPVGAHSAKPEAFLEMIEAYFPSLPKIELNRRGPARLNWSAWGLEADTTGQETGAPVAATAEAPAAPAEASAGADGAVTSAPSTDVSSDVFQQPAPEVPPFLRGRARKA